MRAMERREELTGREGGPVHLDEGGVVIDFVDAAPPKPTVRMSKEPGKNESASRKMSAALTVASGPGGSRKLQQTSQSAGSSVQGVRH